MALSPVSSGDPHVAAHNAERDVINYLSDTVPSLIPKPSSPSVGDILRYDGNTWVASTVRLFEGDGQPEGRIAAPKGSTYIQLDASTGAVRWIKARGTGLNDNTGWILELGDTGWRNILALVTPMPSGASKYAANIRRLNNWVEVYFDLDTPATGTSWNVCTLPSGFRPAFIKYGALIDNNENAAKSSYVSSSGTVNLQIIQNKRDRFHGSWFTDDPWPNSLPGVAL